MNRLQRNEKTRQANKAKLRENAKKPKRFLTTQVMRPKPPSASAAALDKARKLARKAAREDHWLSPSDNAIEEYNADYGDFEQQHRDEWEQTTHFQVLYIEALCEISEADAEKQGVDRIKSWDLWYNNFQLEVKEAFWDEWEEKVKLYEFWEENVKTAKV